MSPDVGRGDPIVHKRKGALTARYDGPETLAPATFTAVVTDLVLSLDSGSMFIASTRAIAASDDARRTVYVVRDEVPLLL